MTASLRARSEDEAGTIARLSRDTCQHIIRKTDGSNR